MAVFVLAVLQLSAMPQLIPGSVTPDLVREVRQEGPVRLGPAKDVRPHETAEWLEPLGGVVRAVGEPLAESGELLLRPEEPRVREVVLSPDFHKGAGIPIGTVLATQGFAVPQAIGNDVNCGMRLMAR